MDVPNSELTGAEGVAAVETRILELGWIFRRQPELDVGIDAQIEVRINLQATGRILAVQIKSGPSYFNQDDDDAITFRGKLKHLDYWLEHDLPVIVILYDPRTKHICWQVVTVDNVIRGMDSWKMLIPRKQTLAPSSLDRLFKIASRNKEIKEEHEADREEFHCPFCNAELVGRGDGPPSEYHVSEYKGFACGYSTIDGILSEPCPYDPRFPKFEDYELKFFESKGEDFFKWSCYAIGKTDMARRVQLGVMPGRTQEEATKRVHLEYERRGKRTGISWLSFFE
jgi:hypothetical protein